MIEKLRAQLTVLRCARFGRSSEKLDAQVEQLELMIDDPEAWLADVIARIADHPINRLDDLLP